MLKKILRIIFTILGAIVGYGVFSLLKLWLIKSGTPVEENFTEVQLETAGMVFAIIFGIIFYRLTPAIRRQGAKVADNIENDLRGVNGNDLLVGVIGLITGLVIALLITQIFANTNSYVYTIITIITYLIMDIWEL